MEVDCWGRRHWGTATAYGRLTARVARGGGGGGGGGGAGGWWKCD